MPKHPGHTEGSRRTGRTEVGGNREVKLPINIATSNPSKIQAANNQSGSTPNMMVPRTAGKFTLHKGR